VGFVALEMCFVTNYRTDFDGVDGIAVLEEI